MDSTPDEARIERDGSGPVVAGLHERPTSSVRHGTTLGSLRSRLIASHVVVLLLALALVLGISAVGLRRYERRAQIDELQDLAVPLLVEARVLLTGSGERDGVARLRLQDLLTFQAAETETRIFVLEPNAQVHFDSDQGESLQGQVLLSYQEPLDRLLGSLQGRSRVVRTVLQPGARSGDLFAGQIVVIAAGGRAVAGQSLPQSGAVMIVAPVRRQGLTGRFLPPLLAILAIALAVAVTAGYLISRRIAAPVARLTVAADAMAAGDLEQAVPDEGSDEIGRLVSSFNTMSRQIAATSRSQRQLLADIAHALRTPLTSVQGYAQALRDDVLPGDVERQRALVTIGQEADRMSRLIRQLLELARLESGQARLHPRQIALPSFLDRARLRFALEAERRGVALIVAAASEATARADEDRLNQILDNLIGNALRHTPAGGEVVLAAAPVDAGAGRTRITVRDSGSGIAAERLERIFDRFERGEDGADRDGFGLGLAIVRELVQIQGGTIGVTSRLGAGTTFAIELPAGQAADLR